jgi:uncharacterized membrane protein
VPGLGLGVLPLLGGEGRPLITNEVAMPAALASASSCGDNQNMSPFDLITLLCALGCGIVGGVFYAFSSFVMRALANVPPTQGIAVMQSINLTVFTPWFMTPFLGTGVFCIYVAVVSLPRWQSSPSSLFLAGSLLYLVGVILVTMVCNVPRNDTLQALAPASPEAARYWVEYLSSWTLWNHVRTVAALAAAVSFVLGFRLQR